MRPQFKELWLLIKLNNIIKGNANIKNKEMLRTKYFKDIIFTLLKVFIIPSNGFFSNSAFIKKYFEISIATFK